MNTTLDNLIGIAIGLLIVILIFLSVDIYVSLDQREVNKQNQDALNVVISKLGEIQERMNQPLSIDIK